MEGLEPVFSTCSDARSSTTCCRRWAARRSALSAGRRNARRSRKIVADRRYHKEEILMKEVDSAVGSARLRSNMLRRDMAPPEGPSNGAGQRAGKCRGDGAKQSGATTCRGGWQRRCATSWPRCWPTASTWEDGGGEWAREAAHECLSAQLLACDRILALAGRAPGCTRRGLVKGTVHPPNSHVYVIDVT